MNLERWKSILIEKKDQIEQTLNRHRLFDVNYGTSGFRAKSIFLDKIVLKTTLFQFHHSVIANNKAVGLMITASHNPAEDNGIKLSDPFGFPLKESLEMAVAEFCSSKNDRQIIKLLTEKQIVTSLKSDEPVSKSGEKPVLFIGRDSRDHSDHFSSLIAKFVNIFGDQIAFKNFGYTSSPQLFGLVGYFNLKNTRISDFSPEIYLDNICHFFTKLSKTVKALLQSNYDDSFLKSISVDCSNGIGSLLLNYIDNKICQSGIFKINCFNSFREGTINKNCGAEFLRKKMAPTNSKFDVLLASLDGDADRILFYKLSSSNELILLNGDRILVLFVKFLKLVVSTAKNFFDENNFTFKAVITAYTNGNCVRYLHSIGVETALSATGVKNLHPLAAGADIGVYFETNGHGTVLFSDRLISQIEKKLEKSAKNEPEGLALQSILLLHKLANQNYADAVGTLMAAQIIFNAMRLKPEAVLGLYENLPSREMAIKVKDNKLIKRLSKDESRILDPEELQKKIDFVVSKYKGGRCFVRPSGTEDLIRIYVESEDAKTIDQMIEKVKSIINLKIY